MSTIEHVRSGFPRELLSRTKGERLEYFRGYTVPHTRLKTACEKLKSAILDTSDTADADLIFFAGPTGVGKTKLLRFLEEQLLNYLLAELQGDRGRRPFVTVEVPAPETSVFPWKSLYKRILLGLDEPLIERKIMVPDRPRPDAGSSSPPRPKVSRSSGVDEVRLALESALVNRRPLVTILDEGQHLMKVAHGRKLSDQLDLIKSMANLSGVPHLLVGTYDLLPFLDLNGQLTRRTTVIHLPRYHNTPGEDPELFANVVDAFQRHLPVAEQPDLVGQIEYLYQHTLGCVGMLKNWLRRALNTALDEGAYTVTKKHLKEHAITAKGCRRMLEDAQKGERYFADEDEELALLQRDLGMSSAKPTGLISPQPGDAGATKPTRKRQPFQRKPVRDPVGEYHPCIQN